MLFSDLFCFLILFVQIFCANSRKVSSRKKKAKTKRRPSFHPHQSDNIQENQESSNQVHLDKELNPIPSSGVPYSLVLSEHYHESSAEQIFQESTNGLCNSAWSESMPTQHDKSTHNPRGTPQLLDRAAKDLNKPIHHSSSSSFSDQEHKEKKPQNDQKPINTTRKTVNLMLPGTRFGPYVNLALQALYFWPPVSEFLREKKFTPYSPICLEISKTLEFIYIYTQSMETNFTAQKKENMVQLWERRVEDLISKLDLTFFHLLRSGVCNSLLFLLFSEIYRELCYLGKTSSNPLITLTTEGKRCHNCKTINVVGLTHLNHASIVMLDQEIDLESIKEHFIDHRGQKTCAALDSCCLKKDLGETTTFIQAGVKSFFLLSMLMGPAASLCSSVQPGRIPLEIDIHTGKKLFKYVLSAWFPYKGNPPILIIRKHTEWICIGRDVHREKDPEHIFRKFPGAYAFYELEGEGIDISQ